MTSPASYLFTHETGTMFKIAKFQDSVIPTSTYYLMYNEHHQVCDCPSFKHPCKHIGMLAEWLEQPHPEKVYFDGESGTWCNHPFEGDLAPEGIIERLRKVKS